MLCTYLQVFELGEHLKQSGLDNKENVPWDGGVANPAVLDIIRHLVHDIHIITHEAHRMEGLYLPCCHLPCSVCFFCIALSYLRACSQVLHACIGCVSNRKLPCHFGHWLSQVQLASCHHVFASGKQAAKPKLLPENKLQNKNKPLLHP